MYNRVHQYSIVLGVLLGLLFFQFVLGMFANLFSNFPSPPAHPQQGFAVARQILQSGLPVVIIHALNGIVLLALSAIAVALAERIHHRSLLGLSLVGLFAIIVSVYSGYHFVYSGWVDNLYSYTMSLGFITTFAANFAALSIVFRTTLPQG